MKISFLFLTTILTSLNLFAQTELQQKYGCYASLAASVNEAVLLDERHLGLEKKDKKLFLLVSAKGIQSCTHSNRKKYVQIQNGESDFLIDFSKSNFSIAAQNKSNILKSEKAKCVEAPDVQWTQLLEHRINQFRQECDNPDKRGMSTAPSCLAEFIAALKPCAAIREWSVYISEVERAAKAAQLQRQKSGQPTEIDSAQ